MARSEGFLLSMGFLMACCVLTISQNCLPKDIEKFKATIPEPDSTLKGWTQMTKGFIKTVFGSSALDAILTILDKLFNDRSIDDPLKNLDVMEFLKAEAGLFATVVISLLTILLMGISCSFMVCCRCCCKKCGANGKQRPQNDLECRRRTYISLLFVVLIFIVVALLFSFLVMTKLGKSVQNTDDNISSVMHDVVSYVNNTYDQLLCLGVTELESTIKMTVRQLSGLFADIQSNVTEELSFNELIYRTKVDIRIGELINPLNTSLNLCNENDQNTSIVGKDFKTELESFKRSCSATDKVHCDKVDEDLAVYQSRSDKIQETLNKLNKIQKFSDEIQKVLDEASIEDTLNRTTQNIQQELLKFQDIRELKELKNEAEKIRHDVNKEVTLYKANINKVFFEVKKHNYINYGPLFAILLLIVIPTTLCVLGLCCGIFGYSNRHYDYPLERTTASNCGGCLLMASVYLYFLFWGIIMIITTALFICGSHIDVLICNPLFEDDFKTIDKIYSISTFTMQKNIEKSNFNLSQLTPSSVLNGCKNGKTIYQTLNLEKILKLESVLDFSKSVKLGEQIDQLDFASLFDDFKKLNNLEEVLKEIKDYKTEDIEPLIKLLNEDDFTDRLAKLETQLDSAEKNMVDKTKVKQLLLGIKTVQDVDQKFKKNIVKLEDEVKNIQSNKEKALKAAEAFIDGFDQTLETKINEIESSIKMSIRDLLTKAVDGYKDEVLNSLNNETAKCKVVWNTLDVGRHVLCREILDPINGYWFGVGWCLFFEIFAIAFATKLSKHFYRMDEIGKIDKECNDYRNLKSSSSLYPSSAIILTERPPTRYQNQGFYDGRRIPAPDY